MSLEPSIDAIEKASETLHAKLIDVAAEAETFYLARLSQKELSILAGINEALNEAKRLRIAIQQQQPSLADSVTEAINSARLPETPPSEA